MSGVNGKVTVTKGVLVVGLYSVTVMICGVFSVVGVVGISVGVVGISVVVVGISVVVVGASVVVVGILVVVVGRWVVVGATVVVGRCVVAGRSVVVGRCVGVVCLCVGLGLCVVGPTVVVSGGKNVGHWALAIAVAKSHTKKKHKKNRENYRTLTVLFNK